MTGVEQIQIGKKHHDFVYEKVPLERSISGDSVRGLWIGKRGCNEEPDKKLVLVEYETGSVVAYEMTHGPLIPDGRGGYMRMFSDEHEKWRFEGEPGKQSPLTLGRHEWTDPAGWTGKFSTTKVVPEEGDWILGVHKVQFIGGAGIQFAIYTWGGKGSYTTTKVLPEGRDQWKRARLEKQRIVDPQKVLCDDVEGLQFTVYGKVRDEAGGP